MAVCVNTILMGRDVSSVLLDSIMGRGTKEHLLTLMSVKVNNTNEVLTA